MGADMTEEEFLAASVFAAAIVSASVMLAEKVHPKGDAADVGATSMMMADVGATSMMILMSAQVQHACLYNADPDIVLERAAEYLTEKVEQLRTDAKAMADAAAMFASRKAGK